MTSDSTMSVEELMGKDVLLERVRVGEGEIAEVGVIVRCNYKSYFYSLSERRRLSEEPFENLHNQCYQIGEGDTVPGLELALRHSHPGDISRVFCASKFAYGFLGRCHSAEGGSPINGKVASIPPNMDLEYEIEVLQHVQDGELDESLHQKCESALVQVTDKEEIQKVNFRYRTLQGITNRKEAGNRWFNALDYQRAAKAYSKATKIAEGYFNPEKQQRQSLNETMEETAQRVQEEQDNQHRTISQDDHELVEAYIAVLNNLAACKLSLKEYLPAKDLCVQVLQLAPTNSKALLRAAKATLALDSFEESEACLKRLLHLPGVEDSVLSAAKVEYKKLKKAQEDYRAQTKGMQKRMANKLFGSKPSKAPEAPAPTSPRPTPTDYSDVTHQETVVETSHVSAAPSQPLESDPKVSAASTSAATAEVAEKEKSEIAEKAAAAARSASQFNVLVLIVTSLVVVVVSCVVAYLYSQ